MSTANSPTWLEPNSPAVSHPKTVVADYSERLNQDRRWALSEGSRFFEGRSAVQAALERMAGRLDQLGIPYAVVEGMALFHHGYRRFTEDIDILVTESDLARIHEQLEGRGYLPLFPNSRHLRDTQDGVRIVFLTTGGYPGDGQPKPVAFPDPEPVSIESDGIRYVNLPTLIELKLASGMSSPGRLRDLADVQELIKALQAAGFVRRAARSLRGRPVSGTLAGEQGGLKPTGTGVRFLNQFVATHPYSYFTPALSLRGRGR
jgi:hypothetical protein